MAFVPYPEWDLHNPKKQPCFEQLAALSCIAPDYLTPDLNDLLAIYLLETDNAREMGAFSPGSSKTIDYGIACLTEQDQWYFAHEIGHHFLNALLYAPDAHFEGWDLSKAEVVRRMDNALSLVLRYADEEISASSKSVHQNILNFRPGDVSGFTGNRTSPVWHLLNHVDAFSAASMIAHEERNLHDSDKVNNHQIRLIKAYLEQYPIHTDSVSGVGGTPAKLTEENVKEALQQSGGSITKAATRLSVSLQWLSKFIKRHGIQVVKSAETKQAERERIRESVRQQWAEMPIETRKSRINKVSQAWENKSEEEMQAHAKKANWWETAQEEQRRAHGNRVRQNWVSMSAEERQRRADEHSQSVRLWWSSLTPEQQQQHVEKIRQGWSNMSEEARESFCLLMKERWDAMTPEDQRRALTAMQHRKKQKKGEKVEGVRHQVSNKQHRGMARIGETAKEEAIRELSKTNPIAALASEDCPEDVWWELAEKFPAFARESVLWDVMTLDLTRMTAFLERRKDKWYETSYDSLVQAKPALLSDQAKRLLAVECAAKVLPYFEEKYPKEKRPALAIKEAILFAFDRSTKENLEQAWAAAWAAYSGAAEGAARAAARAAAWAAADSAARAADGAAVSAAGKITRQEFYQWAWQRALAFLYDPNQLPSPWNQFPDLPPPYDRIMATGMSIGGKRSKG